MKSHLFVNNLVKWISENNDNKIDRVLWIDESYEIAFLIDIHEENALPRQRFISEIEEALESGIAIIVDKDPWTMTIAEEKLSDKEKILRDTTWEIISALVVREPDIYDRRERGSLIEQAVENYATEKGGDKLRKASIYKYLKRYWQRGKIKNALLPDYRNSGGKGKQKSSGDRKRGRPKKYAHDPLIGPGVNITEETKKIFRLAFLQFHNPKKMNMTAVYEDMIKQYYPQDDISYSHELHGSITLRDQRPTLVQFRYWYEVEHGKDIEKKITTRIGKKEYRHWSVNQ